MKKIYITITIILILVIAGTFIAKGKIRTGNAINDNVKEFTLEASRFKYSPDAITVNKGDKVKINVNNIDTMHGIRIPDLNVRGDEAIEFTADKSGEFTWYCNVFCGEEHRAMKGKLIVKQ